MADVLEQVERGHAVWLEQGGCHHVCADMGVPLPLGQFLVFYTGFGVAALEENTALYIAQVPGAGLAGADLPGRCVGLRGNAALFVELKDPHIDQATVWANGAHIDGVGVVVLLFLEPGPCGASAELAQVAYLDQLGGLVGQWCQVVAHSKR